MFSEGRSTYQMFAVIYQGDDAIDLDQNYAGTIDNFIVVMGGGDGDEGMEIDGPGNSTYTGWQICLFEWNDYLRGRNTQRCRSKIKSPGKHSDVFIQRIRCQ